MSKIRQCPLSKLQQRFSNLSTFRCCLSVKGNISFREKAGAVIKYKTQASSSVPCPHSQRRYRRLARGMRHFSPAEVSSSCLLIRLSRSTALIRITQRKLKMDSPLSFSWCFTGHICCAIIATTTVQLCDCRYDDCNGLKIHLVWRIDKIYFQNSYCRIKR